MKLLHVTPSFYPATYWGGPIWSTKAICDAMAGRADLALRVLTTDSAGPARIDRVTPADLPYPVHYARRIAGHSIAPDLLRRLPAAMRWADVVHLTGVYNAPTLPVMTLARIMGKPLVWSPRGALQATHDWLQAPNRRAKRQFERLLNTVRPAGMVMHVTAAQEAATSLDHFAGIATRIIANAVDIPDRIVPRQPKGRQVRLMSMGRLHPKKGLDALIAAMGRLPAHFSLDIYGTGDAAYTRALHLAAAPLGSRVRFYGHLDDAGKPAAFAQADLFVLPSRSENFGIVVAEALAHAVPVLTTDRTPWQAITAHGCGRTVDLVQTDLAQEIASLAQEDLAAMGARGRDWMARDFAKASMAARFEALYRDMAAGTTQEVFA